VKRIKFTDNVSHSLKEIAARHMKGADMSVSEVKNRKLIKDLSADSENDPPNLSLNSSFPI
jgi:hypothetical protein